MAGLTITALLAAVAAGGALDIGLHHGGGSPLRTTALVEADSGNFHVTAYDITMSYQPTAKALQGVTAINATAIGALDEITLQLTGPTARSVTIDSAPVKSFSQSDGQDLVVVPAAAISPGTRFTIQVTYDGTPGSSWLPTASGGATAFEGAVSSWFPAHQNVNERSDFRLSVTVPNGWSAVSIGQEGPVRQTPATTTFHWAEPDADPANIALSIDNFTIEHSALPDGTPVVNAYAPGLEAATKPLADQLPDILGFLSSEFGPYPFPAAGDVFVQVNDDGPGTAPETRPVYLGAGNSTYMTLDEVVHEQTHQWYGVSAEPSQPDDDCLAECFAVYSTWLWDAAKDGADLDARYRQQVDANKGNAGFWQPLYTPGQATGINEYTKGPLALHALRRYIGDAAFFRLLKQWPRDHRGDFVTVPRFEALAEAISGQDLTGFFQAWFSGSAIPADEYLWPGALKTQAG